MADISKCQGRNCEKRETCYRFTAQENPHRQSYILSDENPKECQNYWPIKEEKPQAHL